jgi:hypothetical protein
MGRVVTEALRALPTHAIVWIDEADRLPIDTLTEIRTLAEFDDNIAQTFSVVLSGAPELVAMLDDQRLFALKRRISVPLTLMGLARDELEAFIIHRFGSADAARVSSAIPCPRGVPCPPPLRRRSSRSDASPMCSHAPKRNGGSCAPSGYARPSESWAVSQSATKRGSPSS